MTAAATIKLDARMRASLERLAATRRRSPGHLAREAIAQYVQREKARQRAEDAAYAAYLEFKATGRSVPDAEVQVWLAKLERGERAPPPRARKR